MIFSREPDTTSWMVCLPNSSRIAEFTVPDRSVDDYHFLAWCGAGNNAMDHAIMRALGEGGVDWIDNTGMSGATEASARALLRNAAKLRISHTILSQKAANRAAFTVSAAGLGRSPNGLWRRRQCQH